MWFYMTKAGTFYIAKKQGLFHVLFNDESLGGYATPQQAADDLAGGHTFSAGPGIDTSRLGIPDDINEWHQGEP